MAQHPNLDVELRKPRPNPRVAQQRARARVALGATVPLEQELIKLVSRRNRDRFAEKGLKGIGERMFTFDHPMVQRGITAQQGLRPQDLEFLAKEPPGGDPRRVPKKFTDLFVVGPDMVPSPGTEGEATIRHEAGHRAINRADPKRIMPVMGAVTAPTISGVKFTEEMFLRLRDVLRDPNELREVNAFFRSKFKHLPFAERPTLKQIFRQGGLKFVQDVENEVERRLGRE